MANEGPATGAANNGPHEVNPDPSKGNVDAPHQRAETSSTLGNLERMSNNSGLHNSPGLYRVAHPHAMLGELALGQIHNWQMYTHPHALSRVTEMAVCRASWTDLMTSESSTSYM